MNEKGESNQGIGFFGALALLFIALKLLGVITWSWWWVLSPILIGALLIIVILVALYLWVKW